MRERPGPPPLVKLRQASVWHENNTGSYLQNKSRVCLYRIWGHLQESATLHRIDVFITHGNSQVLEWKMPFFHSQFWRALWKLKFEEASWGHCNQYNAVYCIMLRVISSSQKKTILCLFALNLVCCFTITMLLLSFKPHHITVLFSVKEIRNTCIFCHIKLTHAQLKTMVIQLSTFC